MKKDDAPNISRVFEQLGRLISPEMARGLVKFRFDTKTQARIDRLARKCNEGQLTDAERSEYESYVQTIDFIAMLKLQARAALKRQSQS
jgi:hypothetical protein